MGKKNNLAAGRKSGGGANLANNLQGTEISLSLD